MLLHLVDAAASDAENLCKSCLASIVYILLKFLFQNLLNDSARRVQYATLVLFIHSTVQNEFFMNAIEIRCKLGMFIKSCR